LQRQHAPTRWLEIGHGLHDGLRGVEHGVGFALPIGRRTRHQRTLARACPLAHCAKRIDFQHLVDTGMLGERDLKLLHFVEAAEVVWAFLPDHDGFDLPEASTGEFALDI
jgi:hypothetical protein